MKKLALFIIPLLLFASCFNKPQENAEISYNFIVSESSVYDKLLFQFGHMRAHYLDPEGGKVIRSVYLDSRDISSRLDRPHHYQLGSSDIEPYQITGYDISLYNISLIKGNDTIPLVKADSFDHFWETHFKPNEGESIPLDIHLDVDASVVLDSSGKNWFDPSIKIEWE